MKVLAIDLGKFKSVVCEMNSNTKEYGFETLATHPEVLRRLLERRRPDRVVFEIGNQAGWVTDIVEKLKMSYQVANTNHEIWQWNQTRSKTDRRDALKLVKLSMLDELPTVHIPSASVRRQRGLIRYRRVLVKRRTQIKNSIRALLDSQGLRMPMGRSGWSQAGRLWLREQARSLIEVTDVALWRGQLWVELDQLDSVSTHLAEVTAKLDALGQSDARTQCLQTIPGVGPRLAETVVAILDDPHRFKSGKQVGSYAGLTPRQFQSGQMDRQGKISGKGDTLLRALLVEVSWLSLRHNDWTKEVYERVLRGDPSRKKVAIVAVARKFLVRCWAMLRDGTDWSPPPLKQAKPDRKAFYERVA
jgi:transposase